jgi:hypothetical protein
VSKISENEKGRKSFVLSDEMRIYFKKIGLRTSTGKSTSGFFKTNMQPFYLCMILGIARDKRGKVQPMKESMVEEWVGHAKKFQHELDGLAFFIYCKQLGLIDDQKSDRVLKEMSNFFSPEKNTEFTIDAYNLMNSYAQGGFEICQEELSDPTDLADWLSLYIRELEDE